MVNSDEDCSLARRILRDLRIIFEREPNLLEFDIIPIEDKICNKSPVILQDHRLALESWSIKHLYQYTYHQFIESRNNHIRRDKASLHEWTRCLLLLNPDLTTAWNCRKQLVLDGFITIADELKFSELILKRPNKAPENFAHRQWLLRQLMQSQSITDDMVNNELNLCYEAADRYQSHYHAWNHRRWVIQELGHGINICFYELETNKNWIQRHVSDFSGYSYRQFIFLRLNHLLKKSVTDRNNSQVSYYSMLLDEMEFIADLLNVHPSRESFFIYRRFLLSQLNPLCSDRKEDLHRDEMQFIQQGSHDQFLLTRHVRWCSKVLKWDMSEYTERSEN
ncbi:protein prenyltransferase alpha subunit repeat-containing protein 1-B-like [Brevipalpus obovatus]|uniref:protein prenyltransferase alpha subunit repeat-containing protein 1-B-like n=1 Tax=Brevipalpus obovatus TaxID=246614 RepID=UPI003D9E0F48